MCIVTPPACPRGSTATSVVLARLRHDAPLHRTRGGHFAARGSLLLTSGTSSVALDRNIE